MTKMFRVDFIFFLSIFLLGQFIQCLKLQGTITTRKDWTFLTRFCFLSNKGRIDFYFEYPYNYRYQSVLLYFDDPGQWAAVYKTEKTCKEKLSVLRQENNQQIHLSHTDIAETCKLDSENILLKCVGGRSFRSRRQRWWFIAVSRCDGYDDGVVGLNLTYRLHMTNGDSDDLLHYEFSADEFYILPIDIAFLIAYVGMVFMSCTCAMVLKARQLFHSTYKLYMMSLLVWVFGMFILCISYGKYGDTGQKQDGEKLFGRVLCSISTLIFLLMLILMAKGYTITRGKISKIGKIKIFIFMTLYVIIYSVLFIYEAEFFDPGLVLYLYDSPPGYGLIALRLIGWVWFLYAIFFTLKNYPEKGKFYMPFFIFYSLWFWAGPIMIIVSTFAMKLWVREKIVVAVENTVMLIGHFFFLVLTRPQAANQNFPYHVKTTQIGAMTDAPHEIPNAEARVPNNNNTEMNRFSPSRSYMISSQVDTVGTGPNFTSLFVTSQTYSEKTGTNSTEATEPTGESPPPDYPGHLPLLQGPPSHQGPPSNQGPPSIQEPPLLPPQGRLPPISSNLPVLPSAPPVYDSLFRAQNHH